MVIRIVRRRRWRWLPEVHRTAFFIKRDAGGTDPLVEWLALWLQWGVAITVKDRKPRVVE